MIAVPCDSDTHRYHHLMFIIIIVMLIVHHYGDGEDVGKICK